ncbi:MAG: hypothetical protein IH945_08360 [Armatimonadetes bacterium]|nr:hypothetical protein [Armatimonadota bacterium]
MDTRHSFLGALALIGVLSLSTTALSQNEYEIGGRRASGMGGAGLAAKRDAGYRGFRNPAAYGLSRGFRFLTPTIGYHMSGLNLKELQDNLGSTGSGGVPLNTLGEFAQMFGDERARFGAVGDAGLNFGGLHVGASGFATVMTVPNAPLQAWVASGGDPLTLVGTERLDGYGLGVQTIDVAFGRATVTPDGRESSVGARARIVRSYYSHHFADSATIGAGGGSSPGTEMGGANVVSKSGLALDVGYLMDLDESGSLTGAVVLNNLLEPGVGVDAALSGGGTSEVHAFKRTLNFGVAMQPSKELLYAVDLIDVGNNSGATELRFGGEFMAGSAFGFRAGYAGRTGWSVGATVLGIQVSVSKELPLGLTTNFKF